MPLGLDPEHFEHLFRVAKQRAEAGDAAAMHVLGSLYVDKALQSKNAALLEDADRALRRAGEMGDMAAQRFVAGAWPNVKEEYLRRIADDLGNV